MNQTDYHQERDRGTNGDLGVARILKIVVVSDTSREDLGVPTIRCNVLTSIGRSSNTRGDASPPRDEPPFGAGKFKKPAVKLEQFANFGI